MMSLNIECAVSENIHTPPTDGIGISWEWKGRGGGGKGSVKDHEM